MTVVITRVTAIERGIVETANGGLYDTKADLFEVGSLVFQVSGGSLVPSHIAHTAGLRFGQAKATSDPAYWEVKPDGTIINVKRLYPVEPRLPGVKPIQFVSLVEGTCCPRTGVYYHDLLGCKQAESGITAEDDPFDLDEELTPGVIEQLESLGDIDTEDHDQPDEVDVVTPDGEDDTPLFAPPLADEALSEMVTENQANGLYEPKDVKDD